MNKTILATAVASLLTHSSLLSAQELQADETMVVTANRFEQSADSVLAAMNVATRYDIERIQAKSVADVLKRMPGVEVTHNGGRGQNTSVMIRGANSSHTLVMVDGVRASSSVGSGTSINQFPIGMVERIEVIRGPSAAKYGSDAIGGVVNIITRSKLGDDRKQVSIGMGSLGHKEASFVTKSDVNENGHLQVAAGFDQIDGYNVRPLVSNAGDKHGSSAQNMLLSYEHKVSEETSGYISASWFDNATEYESYGKNHGESERNAVTAQLDHQSGDWQSFINANYQVVNSKNYKQSEGRDKASTHSTTDMLNLQWANLYQLDSSVEIGGGLDWRRESLDDDAFSYGSKHSLAGESRTNIGGFVSASYQHEALTLEANARHDRHDKYDNYNTWAIAVGYKLNEKHRVRASYGTAYKAPTYSSLLTNPELEPEKSNNIEVGFSGVYSTFQWNVSAYDNKIDNLNFWYSIPNFPPYNGKTYNVDARIKGVEVDVQFATGIVQHTLVAEYKDHKDDKGTQLSRRAKENYKWLADVYFGDANVNVSYLYTGRRLDLPTETPTSEDYLPATGVWDISASYYLSSDLVVNGKVSNILNEEYETAKGYPAPERAYYLSATYQF